MKETKWISEAEYLTFKQGLRGVLIKTLIGFSLGIVFFFIATDSTLPEKLMSVLMLTCLPYAWSVIPIYGGIITLFFKLVISLAFGWLITPLSFIYNFVQMKSYEKNIQFYIQKETSEKEQDIEREQQNVDRIIDAIENLRVPQNDSVVYDESLFHGCSDIESLTKRYKNLMKIYHPDNSSGDVSMTQKIQYTYKKLLQKYQNE